MSARLSSPAAGPELLRRLGLDRSEMVAGAGILIALGLWLVSLPLMDPDGVDSFGIFSILPWQYWAAVVIISGSFAMSTVRRTGSARLRIAAVVGLILMLHATPAIVYEELRYSWAWKHIGVIDFIMRHGDVDRTAAFLTAYHNWPGFFRLSAWLAGLLDLGPLGIAQAARYFPVLANLGFVLVLAGIYRRFTSDTRLIHASLWVFVCINWIGQDYFSPQALTYFLYLFALLLCLGPLMPWPARREGSLRYRIAAIRDRFCHVIPLDPLPSTVQRIAALILLALTIYAITDSHQLTPIILALSLTALALTTPLGIGYAIFAGLMLAFWILYPAAPYSSVYLPEEVAGLGQTVGGATQLLVDTSKVGFGTAVVVWAGRLLSGGAAILAAFGALRRLWHGERDGVVWVLLLAPALILVFTSYGGEAIFRIFFFALPFIAFSFAGLIFPTARTDAGILTLLTLWLLSVAMIVGFILANNGKDEQYRFTPDEVEAAYWLYSRAGPDTLLVEGARSYPGQIMNYENLFYVPITDEPPEAQARIFDDPAGVLDDWFSDSRWQDGYIILTRSQAAYLETNGVTPVGTLDRLALDLLASPDFRLVHANRDARIFRSVRFIDEGATVPEGGP